MTESRELSNLDHDPEFAVREISDHVSLVEVNCELDTRTVPALRQLLVQEITQHHRVLLVNLSGCEFMGSSGISALAEAHERATESGTVLGLTGLTRMLVRVLDITSLTEVFLIYPTVTDALQALEPGSAPCPRRPAGEYDGG